MAITRWDPFPQLARFDREFDDMIRRGFGTQSTRAGFVPPVEVLRRESDVVLRLELPGMDVERDVEVEVDKGRLVIKGERRDERAEEGTAYLLRELRYGSFRREFALPEGVTAENVDASYDSGMLEVVVRDAIQPEPQPQQVKINARGTSQAIEAS
ncbi:MAG TPA: Hsp20/alpha crystallin family protein [Frankiaceae bacterium]|nr:Hsp20/alpha crystallin family protein [Frankiaceae bacterium]